MKETIFLVDDTKLYLTFTAEGLRSQYNMLTMSSGKEMFEMLDSTIPALILLDINMPEVDGFTILEKLKSNPLYANIPVIFLSSDTNEETEIRGFEMGAVDFVTKPFSMVRLHHRIMSHINVDKMVKGRTNEVEQMRFTMLSVLANVVGSHANLAEWHTSCTAKYVSALIEAMIQQGIYASIVSDWDKDSLAMSAALYDIGKASISHDILNKPGELTAEEFDIVKTHAVKGVDIINRVIFLTKSNKYLGDAGSFAEFHHENWDGTGYPHGLSGTKIPLQGRIMAIADVYNALVSDKLYRKAFDCDEAARIIEGESGKKFDPKLVNTFLSIKDKFKEIREEHDARTDKNRKLWESMFSSSDNQSGIAMVAKNKILIIDDESISLLRLTNMLSNEFDISVAREGISGIDIAKKEKPSVILLDVIMPAMDGYEVITALKKDVDTKDIPVIFLTGRNSVDDKVKGLMLGAADHINKPCNEFALKARINNLLNYSQGHNPTEVRKTGVVNPASNLIPRNHFYDIFDVMWRNAAVSRSRITFVIFHAENFEDYSEIHGLQKAEDMLNELSEIIFNKFNGTALAARWSSGEVALVVPDVALDDVINISKDIIKSFADKFTMYFGVASAIPSLDGRLILNDFILEAFMSLSNAKMGIKQDQNSSDDNNDVVDIILALNDELKHEEMLDMLVTKMMDLTGSDAGTLYMLQNETLHFCIVKNKTKKINKTMEDTTHWAPILVDETNIKNVSAYSVIKREVVVLDDVYSNRKFDFSGTKSYDKIIGYRTKSMLVIPLIAHANDEQKVLGVLQLINATDPATNESTTYQNTSNVQILTALSQIAANALGNIVHKQEIVALNDISMKDALTGLGNRRHFDKVLNREWASSLQHQQPLCFLILDIDFFKQVNDTYGHVSGDIVLKGVAAVIKETLCETDHAARWGGEEFAIILINTDISDAVQVANSVRVAIENASFTVEGNEVVKVTASMGVNSIVVQPDTDYTLTNFISDTDAALYNAKQTGRNRVCTVK